MKKLSIEPTEYTPKILFDCENLIGDEYVFVISGESRPEETKKFYSLVLDWLEKYRLYLTGLQKQALEITPKPIKIKVNFQLDYFNSSSDRMLEEIINIFSEMEQLFDFLKVQINWFYNSGDEDIMDRGLEIKSNTLLSVNILELKSKLK